MGSQLVPGASLLQAPSECFPLVATSRSLPCPALQVQRPRHRGEVPSQAADEAD